MALPIPSAQDVALIVGPNVAVTVDNYRRYLQGGSPWGYGEARKAAFAIFSHDLSRETVVRQASIKGHPKGRTANGEVAGLIWDLKKNLSPGMCLRMPKRGVRVRADLEIPANPVFAVVIDGRPHIFFLQARRTQAPDRLGMQVLATMIMTTHGVGDFDSAGLQLYDLRCPQGCKNRAAVAYSLETLPTLPTAEVDHFLQRFADAYDILNAEGAIKKPRKPAPELPSPQARLFS